MTQPDPSQMTPDEKDALILALLKRIEEPEARLDGAPKTPDNSSVPPSRGRKRNRPPRQKKPRKKRDGPGATRHLTQTPDHVVDRRAETRGHCGTAIPEVAQSVRHAYDHIDLPPIRSIVTRVRLFGGRCPCCRRRARGAPPTNNGAEQALRPSVIFRKVTNGFRSAWGASGSALRVMPRRLVTGLALAILLAGCSPARLFEAGELLHGLGSGRPDPDLVDRRLEAFSVAGRNREADLYLPTRREARAGLVLVPGVAPRGRRDPRLVAFAERLALARFAVFVPEIANLRALKVSAADAAPIADTLAYAAASDHTSGQAGLIAISYAVGPAVVAALRPETGGRVAFFVSIGGYFDAQAVVTFFTTGGYRGPGDTEWRYREPNAYGKWVFVHSNADRLEDADDRALLAEMAERKLADPEAPVDDIVARLGPEGRSVYALLANHDPARVPHLIAGLPVAIRRELQALDLSRRDLSSLDAPVYLVHGRDDAIIPYTESIALKAALPAGRAELYLVDQFAHVDLSAFGLGDGMSLFSLVYSVLGERDRLARRN